MNLPPSSTFTTFNTQSIPTTKASNTAYPTNIINVNPLQSMTNQSSKNTSLNLYESAFVKIFSKQVSRVIGDFWFLFTVSSLILSLILGNWSIFKFGFWASRLVVSLLWIPTVLSSARLASSRGRNEILLCHATYFVFLFISCYSCFMLFKSSSKWIPSLLTCIISVICIKPNHLIDTNAVNAITFARERINHTRIIKLIAFITLSSSLLSSNGWFGFRFIMRLLLINSFNISLIHIISILIEYYLCSGLSVAGLFKGRIGYVLSQGIRSRSHPFIAEQVAREFYNICNNEPFLRKQIFTELVEDNNDNISSLAASRLLCEAIEERLKELIAKEIDTQLNSIKRLEKEIHHCYDTSESSQESKITQPNRPVQPEQTTFRTEQNIFRRSTNTDVQLQDSKLPSFVHQTSIPKDIPIPPKPSLTPRERLLARVINFYYGKRLVGVYFNYLKTKHLHDIQTWTWLIQGISKLAQSSLEEDIHGQTQYALPTLLLAMSECVIKLMEMEQSPQIAVINLKEHMNVSEECDPLRLLLHRELEGILECFGECIEGLKLSEKCKNNLQRLHLFVAK